MSNSQFGAIIFLLLAIIAVAAPSYHVVMLVPGSGCCFVSGQFCGVVKAAATPTQHR